MIDLMKIVFTGTKHSPYPEHMFTNQSSEGECIGQFKSI